MGAKTSVRNLSMDLFKLAASVLVVFVHVPFGQPVGGILDCLARFAIPGFFAIAGFFSLGADCRRLARRMGYLLRLMLWGALLLGGAGCLSAGCKYALGVLTGAEALEQVLGMIPDARGLAAWLLLDQTPVSDLLWYLSAMVKCYAALWCYTRFFGEKEADDAPVYGMGLFLFCLNLVLGVFQRAVGREVSLALLRNALLMGFPMFAMGMFLGQHWERIWQRFSLTAGKLWLLTLAGLGLTLLERQTMGPSEAYLGSVLIVLAQLLLMAKHPVPWDCPVFVRVAGNFGSWSVGLYLVHIPVRRMITILYTAFPETGRIFHSWTLPLWTLGISLVLAMANSWVFGRIKARSASGRK